MGLLRKYCVIYYHVIERKSQERKIGKTINYKTHSLNVLIKLLQKMFYISKIEGNVEQYFHECKFHCIQYFYQF